MTPPAAGVRDGGPLRLLRQETVVELLGANAGGLRRFEASGVTVADGRLLVIFDNLPHLGSLDLDLTPGAGRLVRQQDPDAGYEDVAHDVATGRVFAAIETARDAAGAWRPQIDELTELDRPSARRVRRRWVGTTVRHRNKGIEGLTCVRRDGVLHLLALIEDAGRVLVLHEGDVEWDVVAEVPLPPHLGLADYAGLSVHGDRIAVVSQESSKLWVGRLDPDHWQVSDAGTVHPFPTDSRGRIVYGTVEGVVWLDEDTIAAVSDVPKRHDPPEVFATAASVHLFRLPA